MVRQILMPHQRIYFLLFFPDCIVECLYPIFLQENPKPETEYTSARD